ncbi:hypothetical protein [uncultured Polaribacter sp.]|uniref:hypothetical protein n=1 Tax=uncultured Polaribacter sp. TaxID=174711 RepID=UPI002608291F|nr:hypothetical protein [uncultured Polaribacter sp.]
MIEEFGMLLKDTISGTDSKQEAKDDAERELNRAESELESAERELKRAKLALEKSKRRIKNN